MSLINEALKKAQRARHDGTEDTLAAIGGDAPAPAIRRPAEKSSTALVLGAGALLIVVLSVIATVFLVNRPAAPKPAAAVAAVPPPVSVPEPVAVKPEPEPAPVMARPAEIITPAPKPATVSVALPAVAETKPVEPSPEKPVKAAATPPPPAPPAQPATAATPPAKPAFVAPVITAVLPPTKPDARIADFVESIRLTSIRGAGADGRVLMNNRVYRVNDTVDRSLNLKLTQIATDSLTFTDANGFTYVRNF
ncbi:MAG: hypothetical protein JNK23_03020 [Opitutaceae bacterium]|nr:hypothetical protein [Opitutaceae bacterium]